MLEFMLSIFLKMLHLGFQLNQLLHVSPSIPAPLFSKGILVFQCAYTSVVSTPNSPKRPPPSHIASTESSLSSG